MSDLEPHRFPRAAAYLGGLPDGFRSLPRCTTRAEVAERLARDHGRALGVERLPEPLGALVRGTVEPRAWIPAVVFQAANLMVRDVAFATDEAFHDWTYDASRELFDKPLLRTLMRLMSPTLIVMGSARRWKEFHQGSTLVARTLSAQGPRARARATLTYPEGLYPRLFLSGLEHAFAAALAGARAKNPLVRLADASPTEAFFDVTWE